MRLHPLAKGILRLLVYGGILFIAACSANSSKSRYILAEKLWADGKYAASVAEFEKVVTKDPGGKLGLQALYRAAMTQTLYLAEHQEAIRKFKVYAELSEGTPASWEAQKQIGEILYSKVEQYDQAIQHYRGLLKSAPDHPDAAEYLYRIGRSHFLLWQFDEALGVFSALATRYPQSSWGERAAFEIGTAWFTRAGASSKQSSELEAGAYQKAIREYQKFLNQYPKSMWVPEAKFGIASCLEEMDQLDAAYAAFEELQTTYPSPNVIKIKLTRIRERKLQRSR